MLWCYVKTFIALCKKISKIFIFKQNFNAVKYSKNIKTLIKTIANYDS